MVQVMTGRSAPTHERLSELIGAIYNCILDPAHWNRALAAVAEEFAFANSVMSVLRFGTGEPLLAAATGVDQAAMALAEELGPEVLAAWGGPERIRQLPIDEPVIWSQVVGEEMKRSRYFREWAEPQGLIDAAAVGIVRDSAMIGNIAFGRLGRVGPIGTSELDGLRLLGPHFRRAVTISNIFEMKALEKATLAATLDALTVPVYLVAANLSIVHANDAGRQLLASGRVTRSATGGLLLPDTTAHDALLRSVAAAAKDHLALGVKGIGLPVPGDETRPAQLVNVLPLGIGNLGSAIGARAVAALFIAPGTLGARLPSDAMALIYDLTPAETRVLELIAHGRPQSAVAQELGIATSTVKTHLLRLFQKTGCSRQVDLVRLAAQMTAPV